MQIIKSLPSLLVFLLPLCAISQSSYLQRGTKDEIFLDRLEIKAQTPNLRFSTLRPLSRKLTVRDVELVDSMIQANDPNAPVLSKVDRYNMEKFLMNNSEWSKPRETYLSKKPIAKNFYRTKGNLYEVNTPDFFLAVNPVIQYQQMAERGNSQTLFYNSRGASIRGLIGRKIGFDIYVTDNQERDPLYVQQWIQSHNATPGARFYKNFKALGGVDYFDNRGSISFNATKFIDLQLGYDKNFIGDGYRSLFLSDFSGNALFFKINTRIWKLNYENLFMELVPDNVRSGGNSLLPRKYFRMNHLSVNATKWLNVGLFDAVMFGRKDHFDFQYLLPVLFLRPAESDIGSEDNAVVGLNAKANIKKKVELYGQVLFDEFLFKELAKRSGYWANKFGYQIGLKYPDAFGIRNLDLQLEDNRVRPFTYSHFDSVSNYTHYNQPFAHPLGANFQEFIAILKYQPINRLYLQAKMIYYYQGLDIGTANYGSNIFRSYNMRAKDYENEVGDGNMAKSTNVAFLASYEIFENLFVDFNLQNRSYKLESGGNNKTTVISAGVRWNMARREFDF